MTTNFNTTVNNPGVQISVELLLAGAQAQLTGLLVNAEETTRSYGRKIANRDEQIKRLTKEHAAQVEKLEADRDQARLLVQRLDHALGEVTTENNELRHYLAEAQAAQIGQTNVINNQRAEIQALNEKLESTTNALDERGKTIDHLRAQAEQAAAEVAETKEEIFEPVLGRGVRVKVLPDAHYRNEDGSTESSYNPHEDFTGQVGVITDGPDNEGDFDVTLDGPAGDSLTASPEYLEVVA